MKVALICQLISSSLVYFMQVRNYGLFQQMTRRRCGSISSGPG